MPSRSFWRAYRHNISKTAIYRGAVGINKKDNMYTKKPPRRYETANQIRDAIDLYKRKAQKLMESAAALDFIAEELVKEEGHSEKWLREQIAFNRSQAEKKRKSASRIEDRTLVRLKNKLSEFMTPLIPGMPNPDDRSIPVKGS